jgi:hypothetical protein
MSDWTIAEVGGYGGLANILLDDFVLAWYLIYDLPQVVEHKSDSQAVYLTNSFTCKPARRGYALI